MYLSMKPGHTDTNGQSYVYETLRPGWQWGQQIPNSKCIILQDITLQMPYIQTKKRNCGRQNRFPFSVSLNIGTPPLMCAFSLLS